MVRSLLLLAVFILAIPFACTKSYNLSPASILATPTPTVSNLPYVITYAGTGSPGTSNGTLTTASFNRPVGMTFDTTGNLYFADAFNFVIRKITPGGIVSTYAGHMGINGSVDGPTVVATLGQVWDVAFDAASNLYVTDENQLIRKISNTGVVYTVAGQTGVQGTANGPALSATFDNPDSIYVDPSGDIYVTEFDGYDIRKISGGIVSTFAGQPGINGFTNGPAGTATFGHLWGIGGDSSGNIYVSDWDNQEIRKISGGVVSNFAYIPGGPTALTLDSSGNVYVGTYNGQVINEVTTAGVVMTLAGVYNTQGFTNGPALASTFFFPSGIAINSVGDIFIGDQSNYVVREYIP